MSCFAVSLLFLFLWFFIWSVSFDSFNFISSLYSRWYGYLYFLLVLLRKAFVPEMNSRPFRWYSIIIVFFLFICIIRIKTYSLLQSKEIYNYIFFMTKAHLYDRIATFNTNMYCIICATYNLLNFCLQYKLCILNRGMYYRPEYNCLIPHTHKCRSEWTRKCVFYCIDFERRKNRFGSTH